MKTTDSTSPIGSARVDARVNGLLKGFLIVTLLGVVAAVVMIALGAIGGGQSPADSAARNQSQESGSNENQAEVPGRVAPSTLSPFEEVAKARSPSGSVQESKWAEDDFFGASYGEAAVVVVTVLALILAVRKLGPKIGELLNRHFNPFVPVPASSLQDPSAVVEQARFSEFIAEFRIGPGGSQPQVVKNERERSEKATESFSTDPLADFFSLATKELEAATGLFSEINSCAESAKRQQLLADLCAHIRTIKTKAGSSALRPVWQMTSCLEGLLNQMVEKPANVTPSTLRTVVGALELLESICVPGLKSDLGDNPPARFLCVDDDPISRRAICMALQKAFQSPAVAQNGQEALLLAAEHSYDVVFLDIEMPGMDGFEVCTKLHETETNRTTPVVFVTAHSDFRSRAKSLSAGGRDLVAKPFLSFEIAVKALTLLLRSRLEAATKGGNNEAVSRNAQCNPPEAGLTAPTDTSGAAPATSARGDDPGAARSGAEEFGELRAAISALGQTEEGNQRQELLGDIYVVLHSISSEAEHGGSSLVFQLSTAMGKLTRKLLENPSLSTPSAIESLSGALTLLEELATTDPGIDMTRCPVRVLVVDDDPTCRLALSNAIQLTFTKPDTAGSGDTALALGESNAYDVIFLDVVMPGMDGFAACAGIRKSLHNGATPVVFVTNQISAAARKKAVVSGGTAFISKPALAAEISLIAMTSALRKRKETGAFQGFRVSKRA